MSKNKLEELTELNSTIGKLEQMIDKSKEELKFLEVEWIQLRGLVKETCDNTKKSEESELDTNNKDLDNVNKINAEQFDLSLHTEYLKLMNFSEKLSENESSDND